jgi:uncharacterized protein (TIGR02246 family)
MALWSGYFALAQNRDNAPTPPKPKSTPAPQAAPASPAPKNPAAKAPEPAKPTANAKPADVKRDTAEAADLEEEKTIKAGAADFAKAYNQHDSKRLAAMFAPKAEMIDSDQNVVKGKEAIEKAFAAVFEQSPKIAMEIEVESVRVLTPNLALEEGTSRSKNSPDDREDVSTYVAVHAKVDGKWLLVCVRDWEVPSAQQTPRDHLQKLAWLVGDWVEESPDSVIRTSCQWSDNGNFLVQQFNVHVNGKVAMSGTMRIGWDAVRKQFKSWVFDSNGGHAEGFWLHDGRQWTVKSHGATAAGETTSQTAVYVPVDKETTVWSAFDRIIDGAPREDIPPITVKRRPPPPTH